MNRVAPQAVPSPNRQSFSFSTSSPLDHYETQLFEHALSQWKPDYVENNIHCGFLMKKGSGFGSMRRWKKRWCVLTAHHMFYFKKETDPYPLGILFLDQNTELSDSLGQSTFFSPFSFTFELTVDYSCQFESQKTNCQKRTFCFSAAVAETVASWVKKIESILGALNGMKNRQMEKSNSQDSFDTYLKTMGKSNDSLAEPIAISRSKNEVDVVVSSSSPMLNNPSLEYHLDLMTMDVLMKAKRGSRDWTNLLSSPPKGSRSSTIVLSSSPKIPEIEDFDETLENDNDYDNFMNHFRSRSNSLTDVFSDTFLRLSRFSKVCQEFIDNERLIDTLVDELDVTVECIDHFVRTLEDRILIPLYNSRFSGCLRDFLILLTQIAKQTLSLGVDVFEQLENKIFSLYLLYDPVRAIIDSCGQFIHRLEQFKIVAGIIFSFDNYLKSADEKIVSMLKRDLADLNLAVTRELASNLLPFDRMIYMLVMDCSDITETIGIDGGQSCIKELETKSSSLIQFLGSELEEKSILVQASELKESLISLDVSKKLSLEDQIDVCSASFMLAMKLTDLFVALHTEKDQKHCSNLGHNLLKQLLTVKHRAMFLKSHTMKRSLSNSSRLLETPKDIESSLLILLNDPNLKDDVAVNRVVCKSIIDHVQSSVLLSNEIHQRWPSTDHVTDLMSQILHLCQQVDEESQSLEIQAFSQSLVQRFNDSKRGFYLSVGSLSLSMRHAIGINAPPDANVMGESLAVCDACRELLMVLNSMLREQTGLLQERNQRASIVLVEQEAELKVEKLIESESQKNNLVFKVDANSNLSKSVKAGSLEALVEYLTDQVKPDGDFVYTFILTYQSFTSADVLLDLLIKRYCMEYPSNLTDFEKKIYLKKKLIPVRLRVLNVFKMWVKLNFDDALSNSELMDRLETLVQERMRKDFRKGTEDFDNLLEKAKKSQLIVMETCLSKPLPHPIIPKNSPSSVLDIDPLEMARQMTLLDWDYFCAIRPNEFLNQGWTKQDGRTRSKHILAMINYSNKFVYFVATEIVSQTNLKQRILVVRHFIQIAEKCRRLNNFNSLKMILAALNSSAVRRLKKTWEGISAKYKMLFQEMNLLMAESKSYKMYRQALTCSEPPCIPFLGMYLTNIVFIEVGNRDSNSEGLINFDKRSRIAKVIDEVLTYQRAPYRLQPVMNIQFLIVDAKYFGEEELWEKSLEIEPRESANP